MNEMKDSEKDGLYTNPEEEIGPEPLSTLRSMDPDLGAPVEIKGIHGSSEDSGRIDYWPLF